MTPCTILDWDSRFFQRRIARVTVDRPSPEVWKSILEWCEEQAVDGLYYLVDFDDTVNIHAAGAHGFELVDLRMTLENPLAAKAPQSLCAQLTTVRVATAHDIPFVRSITRGAFPGTRFSRDPHLAAFAGQLYETWVQRNIESLAECVLVAPDNEEAPLGFVSCHLRSPTQGELGLTAVRSDQRGMGVGSRLVTAALHWFQQQKVSSAFVVTNGENIAAQRLYQRHGFLARKTQIWYHRWFRTR